MCSLHFAPVEARLPAPTPIWGPAEPSNDPSIPYPCYRTTGLCQKNTVFQICDCRDCFRAMPIRPPMGPLASYLAVNHQTSPPSWIYCDEKTNDPIIGPPEHPKLWRYFRRYDYVSREYGHFTMQFPRSPKGGALSPRPPPSSSLSHFSPEDLTRKEAEARKYAELMAKRILELHQQMEGWTRRADLLASTAGKV